MVVIVGAGVVGSAAAYYLSTSPYLSSTQRIKILDSVGPAAASSGKAGAFITNRPPLKRGNASDKRQALFEKSFELHEWLAEELNLESFCTVKNYQVVNELSNQDNDDGHHQQTNSPPQPLWLSNIKNSHEGVALPGDAAILDPTELTAALFNEVLARNDDSSFLRATVRGLELDEENRAVQKVLVELGKGDCAIDYIAIEEDEPVLFGRKDRSLYVSGCGESEVIGTEVLRSEERPRPDMCPPNMARAAAAQKSLKTLGYKKSEPDRVQACMRPMSPDAVPVVGKILSNVYVATGGGPWGITWGPLMGKCIESLINEEDPPIRLGPLKPQRFDTLLYQTLLKSRSPM
ncbi:MAG: hypothetical protein SGBAC_001857 [Bacillariaceae sp.]